MTSAGFMTPDPDLEEVLEAVDDLVCTVEVLPPLTQEDGLLVEEHLSLHGFEPQVLHLALVFCGHLEAPLHDQLSLLGQVTLEKVNNENVARFISTKQNCNL